MATHFCCHIFGEYCFTHVAAVVAGGNSSSNKICCRKMPRCSNCVCEEEVHIYDLLLVIWFRVCLRLSGTDMSRSFNRSGQENSARTCAAHRRTVALRRNTFITRPFEGAKTHTVFRRVAPRSTVRWLCCSSVHFAIATDEFLAPVTLVT